ncbi:hypothetical protein CERSUDRAFT_101448 [Gelatoporia subvermispora B]|uniref:Uncharacterized protein n=1 Tax=Ceriporiopsis subvermispora (strain B) TaxID=914234 RepID=M2Q0K3_CERS8|nr:hypothetical protein CERSUDRAFT_101448 [Gelatoporia subvermispora B]
MYFYRDAQPSRSRILEWNPGLFGEPSFGWCSRRRYSTSDAASEDLIDRIDGPPASRNGRPAPDRPIA